MTCSEACSSYAAGCTRARLWRRVEEGPRGSLVCDLVFLARLESASSRCSCSLSLAVCTFALAARPGDPSLASFPPVSVHLRELRKPLPGIDLRRAIPLQPLAAPRRRRAHSLPFLPTLQYHPISPVYVTYRSRCPENSRHSSSSAGPSSSPRRPVFPYPRESCTASREACRLIPERTRAALVPVSVPSPSPTPSPSSPSPTRPSSSTSSRTSSR
jgi:hypothetical protein